MKIFFTILFYVVSNLIHSQGFIAKYNYPGSINNSARGIFETSSGNYITGGITLDVIDNVASNRLCIMGLNSTGQVTWSKKYGNSKFEYLDNGFTSRSYLKDGNNIYFVATVRDSNNNYKGVFLKFNFNGDTIWQRTYSDTDLVAPQMVCRSVDGGFLITGYLDNLNFVSTRCIVIKTDSNGNEVWRKRLSKIAPNAQDGKAIVQHTISKKIVIVGYQYISGGSANAWTSYDNILILDSLGNKLHQLNYVPSEGILFDLIQTSDQKLVAVGATYQTWSGNSCSRSLIVKFDVDFPSTPIWIKPSFDFLSMSNSFYCVRELPNSDLLVGGTLDSLMMLYLIPNINTRLAVFDKNGVLKSNRCYDYADSHLVPNLHFIKSLELTSDKGCVASIYSFNSPNPNPFIFVKWDSTGCDRSTAYCQSQATVSTVGLQLNQSDEDLGISVFPNPTNNILNIKSQDNTNELCISITDLTGRKVKEEKMIGQVTMDLGDLNSGLYLLTVTKDKKIVHRAKVLKQE